MSDDVPGWLMAKVPIYEQLEREDRAIDDLMFGIPACQLLFFAGVIMVLGVVFFRAEGPFYAGMGTTLAVICGGRWWWLSSEKQRLFRKRFEIAEQFRRAGFHEPFRGEVSRISS